MNLYKCRYLLKVIPDKPYLKLLYRRMTHRKLNLKNPLTFNEKLQWLKLYNRKPEYTMMVDKYRVREYIKEKIGEEYLIPLVWEGVWEDADDIDFDALPEQFVLKCNHDSGSAVICKNKNDFDFKAAKKKLNDCLHHNHWWIGREYPYKNVKPCILAEKYMTDESKIELKDYKVLCFDGKPEFIEVDYDRFRDHKTNLYSKNWDYIDLTIGYPTHKEVMIDRPGVLDEMLELSARLSEGIPFLRTDFYVVDNQLYFGELTFFPGSGFTKIVPEEWNFRLGEYIKLPK